MKSRGKACGIVQLLLFLGSLSLSLAHCATIDYSNMTVTDSKRACDHGNRITEAIVEGFEAGLATYGQEIVRSISIHPDRIIALTLHMIIMS
jgi:hypothetical protein